jgi:PPOX class probable F420-dependent enzyme
MADALEERDYELLRKRAFVHLTTLMPDGSPQTTPVWIDADPGQGLLIVNTAEGRVKPRNVRRDPRVSLSVTDPNDGYRALMIRGQVVGVRNDGAEGHIDEMQEKYHGSRPYPAHSETHPRVILEIRPEHIARMGY